MNLDEKKITVNLMSAEEIQYWNLVKGIGIILVVIGHACNSSVGTPVSNYIYLFHLPLFFFVSGYLYNEEKYGDNPYANIASRLKSSWIKYVLIYWVLILLHNLLLRLNMLEESARFYSKTDMLSEMANAVLGMGHEMMGGTLWFVPTVVMASSLFGGVVTFSRKVFVLTHSATAKYFCQGIIVSGCTVLGYILESRQIDLPAHMQIVLVVMPFLWCGYVLRKCKAEWKNYLNFIIALIFGVILCFVNRKYTLDLVFFSVYPYMHIVALLGIYVCLTGAKLLQKIKGIKSIIEIYGKASFWIMFLHFPILKIFDWCYTVVFGNSDFAKYRELPISYTYLWPIYVVIGLGIPIILYGLIIYTRKKLARYEGEKGISK